MVGTRGFEPPTPASRTLCSTRLSHVPTRVTRRTPKYLLFYFFSTFFLIIPADRHNSLFLCLLYFLSASERDEACTEYPCLTSSSVVVSAAFFPAKFLESALLFSPAPLRTTRQGRDIICPISTAPGIIPCAALLLREL